MVVAVVVLMGATAAEAAAPVLHPRNIAAHPGSLAMVDVNLKPNVSYSLTVAMDGESPVTFSIRKTEAFARRVCRLAHNQAKVLTIKTTDSWDFVGDIDSPYCALKLVTLRLDINEPGEPTDATPYDRSLRVVVKRGHTIVAGGNFNVHYRWNADASITIWQDDFDNFVNICINEARQVYASGGKLYCLSDFPVWYVTVRSVG
jgi:hypothetical protein